MGEYSTSIVADSRASNRRRLKRPTRIGPVPTIESSRRSWTRTGEEERNGPGIHPILREVRFGFVMRSRMNAGCVYPPYTPSSRSRSNERSSCTSRGPTTRSSPAGRLYVGLISIFCTLGLASCSLWNSKTCASSSSGSRVMAAQRSVEVKNETRGLSFGTLMPSKDMDCSRGRTVSPPFFKTTACMRRRWAACILEASSPMPA